MPRPLDKPRRSSSKITTLIRTLRSRRKSKDVVDQSTSMPLLDLPDAVLENILLQAHPITALSLGSTCKHLQAEYARHRPDICLKLLAQPENRVSVTLAADVKQKSSRKAQIAAPTLGCYMVQRSFTYQVYTAMTCCSLEFCVASRVTARLVLACTVDLQLTRHLYIPAACCPQSVVN